MTDCGSAYTLVSTDDQTISFRDGRIGPAVPAGPVGMFAEQTYPARYEQFKLFLTPRVTFLRLPRRAQDRAQFPIIELAMSPPIVATFTKCSVREKVYRKPIRHYTLFGPNFTTGESPCNSTRPRLLIGLCNASSGKSLWPERLSRPPHRCDFC